MFGYPHALMLGSTAITQLSDISSNTNIGHYADMGAGQVGPQFLGGQTILSDFAFRTKQIASILATVVVGSEYTCADLSGGNVDLFYKAAKSMALREADNSTVHLRARLQSNALLAWSEISASGSGSAEITGVVKPIYNGSNLPLVYTSGVALSGTSAAAEQYGLGTIKINGTAISQVESLNFSTNPVYDDIQSAGLGMNVFTALESFAPTARIVTRDLAAAATFGYGAALSGNGLEMFFRARLENGLNVAEATTSHLKIVGSTGKVSVNGTSGMRGAVEIVVQLKKPSSGAFFIPTAGVAIA